MEKENPIQPGDTIAGKYTVVREIGVGGMGVVHEAIHVRLGQRVAIKSLLPRFALNGEIAARFDREARAAATIRSPHVARVIDVDALPDGAPYIVMELLEGRDLQAELHARGQIPISEAVGYILHACAAMHEAHKVGIVHRDLKPANLFLTDDGARPVVKVLDFGISKVPTEGESSVTATQSNFGTPQYMSPEQVRSAKHVDGRADIWALGAILHELIAGQPAFSGASATAIVASIVADAPTPLRTLRPEVPEGLDAVVARALSKSVNARYDTVDAFAKDLAPFSAQEWAPRRSKHPVRISVDSLATNDAATMMESKTAGAVVATAPQLASRRVPLALIVVAVLCGLAGALTLFLRHAPEPSPATSARASEPSAKAVVSAPGIESATLTLSAPVVNAPLPPVASATTTASVAKPNKPAVTAKPIATIVKPVVPAPEATNPTHL